MNFNPFRKLSIAEMHAKQLHAAQVNLAEHQHVLEYEQAIVPMLKARVARLQALADDIDKPTPGVAAPAPQPAARRNMVPFSSVKKATAG